ncbi:histidine kinase [Chryseobacterium sp. Leaf180]|uniref:sensor histidine kinase n=1 Tax=Chryseobacterium sp. Leaf180 TaxID=1736289 RepID=UPI0006F27B8F|nr:ATP-binding protein [Chryseobacterium sp. Leaf180]KQR93779.1 histidine kinase [Chryseobacterium sp. Leaf180]
MGKTELLVTLIVFNLFFVMFVIAIVLYINKYRARKKEYMNELQIKNEIHEKELLTMQIEIQKDTMQQIGRELHDNIGQKLTLVSLYAQQFLYENKTEGNEQIDQISQITNESLQDLRNLSLTLTDDNIQQKNVVSLIENEVQKIKSLKKCEIFFENNFIKDDLSFSDKNVLLRIVQEFIQNSIKHSNCKAIHINLESSENLLWKLSIKDDGKGFSEDLIKSNGIGLSNMRKRAEIIKADFSLNSKENEGTEIIIQSNKKP